MKEQQNIELVKNAYNSFKTGNIPALLSNFSDKIVWSSPEIETVPQSGTKRGKDGVEEFFRTISEVQDTNKFEPQEFIAQGNTVAVCGNYEFTVKSTGSRFNSDFVHIFTFEDGKVIRFREFADTAGIASAFTPSEVKLASA